MSQPKPTAVPTLSDADFAALKETINQTIHELVFVCSFLDDDEIESAQNAMMTAQGNLETVAERIANLNA
jgi:hypothetical protein